MQDGRPTTAEHVASLPRRDPRSRHTGCSPSHDDPQRCEDARDALVEANLPFVIKVAAEYRNLGLSFEDLLAEGRLGLVEASRRYNASRGCKFITYAVWWIRRSILEALSRQVRVVRVPAYHWKKLQEVRDIERQLEATLGRKARREEIEARFRGRRDDVDQVLELDRREFSLDAEVHPGSEQRQVDRLVDSGATSPEERLLRQEDRTLIHEALDTLDPREREVIAYRFGLMDRSRLTLGEVGYLLGLSRERVRQIESDGKKRLRRFLLRRHSRWPIVRR